MQLNNAWICIDCDEIFDCKDIKQKNTCPRCAGKELQQIRKWILPLSQVEPLTGPVRKVSTKEWMQSGLF